uniref:Uncharacterized protein n=1 Tax=Cacopsylla melanoneura TaxID=428564 RepID=A0A8D8XA12_9HEMI
MTSTGIRCRLCDTRPWPPLWRQKGPNDPTPHPPYPLLVSIILNVQNKTNKKNFKRLCFFFKLFYRVTHDLSLRKQMDKIKMKDVQSSTIFVPKVNVLLCEISEYIYYRH